MEDLTYCQSRIFADDEAHNLLDFQLFPQRSRYDIGTVGTTEDVFDFTDIVNLPFYEFADTVHEDPDLYQQYEVLNVVNDLGLESVLVARKCVSKNPEGKISGINFLLDSTICVFLHCLLMQWLTLPGVDIKVCTTSLPNILRHSEARIVEGGIRFAVIYKNKLVDIISLVVTGWGYGIGVNRAETMNVIFKMMRIVLTTIEYHWPHLCGEFFKPDAYSNLGQHTAKLIYALNCHAHAFAMGGNRGADHLVRSMSGFFELPTTRVEVAPAILPFDSSVTGGPLLRHGLFKLCKEVYFYKNEFAFQYGAVYNMRSRGSEDVVLIFPDSCWIMRMVHRQEGIEIPVGSTKVNEIRSYAIIGGGPRKGASVVVSGVDITAYLLLLSEVRNIVNNMKLSVR